MMAAPMSFTVPVEIAVALIGVAGVVAVYYLRTNNENRRIINRAVFDLLEVWWLMRLVDGRRFDRFCTLYLSRLRNRMGSTDLTREQEGDLRKMMQNAWALLVLRVHGASKIRFQESYRESVRQLASIDPVLAFRLNGNETIHDRLQVVDEYLRSVDVGNIDPALSGQFLEEFFAQVRGLAFDDAISELERDIQRTALHAGLIAWARCIFKLRNSGKQESQRLIREVDRFLERILDLQTSC